MPCDYSVRVEINVSAASGGRPRRPGLRKFVVEYDNDGQPLRIKEIRALQPANGGVPGITALRHANYWSAGAHPRVGLAAEILAAAHAKQIAEHRAENATP